MSHFLSVALGILLGFLLGIAVSNSSTAPDCQCVNCPGCK